MYYFKTNTDVPLEFISAGQFVSNREWVHSKRNLDSYVAIVGVDETLYIAQESEQYEVKPGDVLFLLPNHVHWGYKPCQSGLSYYWFHFYCPRNVQFIEASTIHREVKEMRSNPYPLEKSNTAIYIPVYSTPKHVERIQILFTQLLDISRANYYNNRVTDYLATLLLIELSEQTITNFYTSFEKMNVEKKLAAILEWIRVHALGDVSVSSIARQFNYNRDYLTRYFKKEVGMSIQEYIHHQKLSKAKYLLTSTNANIKTVADAVGIHDEKYFMRLFKKYEKVTPTEFRKAYYRTHMNNK